MICGFKNSGCEKNKTLHFIWKEYPDFIFSLTMERKGLKGEPIPVPRCVFFPEKKRRTSGCNFTKK